jgi:hypothetical protein
VSVSVRWEWLRLQGFGCHRDLEITFPEGLATWVAPNEAGKSTAVSGLVATVWGLPHLQEPAGFTWGRFRAFDGGPHRGEVRLRRGERRTTIARDFATHRVRVVHHGAAGDETVMEVEHNPNARREASAYLDWLRGTLGIDDAALMLSTFVVAQGDLGGPPHRLGQHVQALLAGAGGGTAQEAEARLEAALRACTRRLKGLAPGLSRDGRSDQALELAEARLRDLEARWRAGRDEADAFARIQREAQESAAAAREAAAAARRLRAAADAQRAWVDLREAAVRALRRAGELERAAAAAAVLDAEVAAARGRVAETHPELAGVDPRGFEERVSAWASAEDARSAHARRLAAARAARDAALREAHDDVAAALAAERAVTGPDGGFAGHAGDIAAVVRGAAGADSDGAAVAVAAAESAARRWRDGLAAVRRERARAEEAAAALEPVRALAALDDDLRAELRGHRAAVAAWAARLQEAEAAWRGWRERLDEAEERFGEVAPLAPAAAADLIAFARAEERPDAWAPWRWIGALAAAGAAVGVARTVGLGSGWASVAAAATGIAWLLAWPRRPALRRARRRLDARVKAGETLLAGDDDRRLELARRREAFEMRRDDLEEFAAGERAAAARLAEVRAGAAAFRERWAPWREALIEAGADDDVDLGLANERFERCTAELADAVERAAAAARSLGVAAGTPVAPARGVPDVSALRDDAPAAGAGPDGARAWAWARAQGALGDGATVAELDAWLARVGGATWQAWKGAAARTDEAAARRREARRRRERAEEEAVRVAREHERAVVAEETAGVEARAAAAVARAAALTGVSGEDVAADPGGVREAWRLRSEAMGLADAAVARLDAHLRAVGAADVAALSSTAEAAGWEAAQALRSWRELVVAHPSLPPAELAAASDGGSSGDVEGAFAATRAAAADAERAADGAQAKASAAQEALARAQGSDPIDVAAVELEIADARAEVAHWAVERDALALAARELAAAAEGFRAGHARRLEAAASAQLATFGGVRGRRVRLDDGLQAEVIEPDGRPLAAAQLSQGARDQLALALRFAVADLMAEDVTLPLVLDDPLLNWDEERSAAVRAALRAAAAQGRQVWLLSHRAELAAWGEPVAVRRG